MSWQATDAVRDHSESRGATRTVAFVLATYADKFGAGVYPSISTIAKQAKVNRKTAVDARRWLIDHGEVEIVRMRTTRTKSLQPDVSFAPLIAKGSVGEPLASEPLDAEGCGEPTLKGSPSDQQGFADYPSKGSLSEPEPPVEPPSKSPEEAAAAAASSFEDDLEQLVNRIYAMWDSEVYPEKLTPLTAGRRQVIVERLGHYEPDEIEQAIRNRENSDWFSGRKPSDHKQRFDLTDLLATDASLEELREAQPPKSDREEFLAQINARAGAREPGLKKILDRGRAEDEEERQRKAAKYDALVEDAYVAPTLTPAQVRAEHGELTDRVGELEAQRMTSTTRSELAEAREELARLERDWAGLFGTDEVAA